MTNDQQTQQPPPGESQDGGDTVKEHVRSGSTWLRLLFMIVVAFLWSVSRIVTGAVVVLQFFWVLFTGSTNENLLKFGESLATYSYQIIRYLTFNTEQRPFPFDADWPTGPPAS
jgi:Flp pilus assembly protein TadB